jgi:cyanate permease
MKRILSYFIYGLIGAGVFWIPDIVIHAFYRKEFGSKAVLFFTCLAPIISLAILIFLTRRQPKHHPFIISLFMLLGIWILGPFFMSIGASFSVGGFASEYINIWTFLLQATILFPLSTWMMSAYDGSMGALILLTLIFMVAWIPLKRYRNTDQITDES